MLPLLLALLFLLEVYGQACPSGYTDDGSGNCQTGALPTRTQFSAYSSCAANNGYMLTVQNAFENANVNFLSNGVYIWLGLTCTFSLNTSCLWDNGVAVKTTSYTNFAPNHPNMSIGACVYFNPANNMWYSSSCGANYSYILPSCPSPSAYFRGKCYYAPNEFSLSNTTARCKSSCAEIASIHNSGENSFVRDVALLNRTSLLYTYIGLSCTASGCHWSDGTEYNYDGFGHKDLNLGSCVFLATSTSNSIVPKNQWLSADCSENDGSVCKRDLSCSMPTDSPGECTEVQYFSGSGEIKSPGYPYGSDANHCQFVITQTTGYGISLFFPELNLDSNSTINIFNDVLDTVPFATLNLKSQENSTIFYSASNLFRIVFDTPGGLESVNRWRASYNPHKEGANDCGGVYTGSATIAGPNSAKNCTYTLRIGSRRTCLRFTNYKVQSTDYIAIYDGEIAPKNNIAYISHNNGTTYPYLTVALCTSNTNYMNLVSIGKSGLSYEMFTISVADSPDALRPKNLGYTYHTNRNVPVQDWHRYYSATYTNATTYIAPSGKKVSASFFYLEMPDPSNIVVIDGNTDSSLALAYGSPTRMNYTSSQNYLTVFELFRQPTPLDYIIGFAGNFNITV